MDGCRRNGEMPESKAWRMGQLLQTWSRHESLSIPGQIHHDPAAPVAMQEAQAAQRGIEALPRRVLLSTDGTHPLASTSAGPSVGEGMMFSPRAGCARCACPVR